jgi:hypothetical protein
MILRRDNRNKDPLKGTVRSNGGRTETRVESLWTVGMTDEDLSAESESGAGGGGAGRVAGGQPAVGRFGYCRFGWTVYRSVPRLRGDFQIRADGQVRQVPRSHGVTFDQIEWLLESVTAAPVEWIRAR